MSEEANKKAVFRTTRVRTPLKNDGCWIQKSNLEKPGARKGHDVETSTVPQHTSVQSMAKKFQPQAPREEMIQKNAQSEKTFANMTAKNKKEYAAAYQSKVQPLLAAAGVSAGVHVAEPIQNGEPQQIPITERKPEAVSPMKPAEQAENKGEKTNETVDKKKSNLEHSEAKVSADAHVDDPKAETCVAPAVKPKPKEEPATKAEQDTATQLEHAGVQSTVQLAKGNCEKGLPEKASKENVEAKAEVAVAPSPKISEVVDPSLVKEVIYQKSTKAVADIVTKPSPKTSNILEATPGNKAALEISVKPVPDLLADPIKNGEPQQIPTTERKPEAVSPMKPAEQAENQRETTNKTDDKKSNLEHSEAKVSADAHVDDPKAETCVAPAVKPKPKEEPATKAEQDTATQLEHAGVQSTVQLAKGNCEKGLPEKASKENVEAKAEVAVAPSPKISEVVDPSLVKEVIYQKSTKAVADIVTKPSPKTSNILEATPGNKAALEISVKPVPDLLAEPIKNGEPQQIPTTERKPEAVSPVKPAEQAENQRETTNKTVDKKKSNLEHSEAKVSADAHVDDPKAETCVAPAVKPKPKEEPATKAEQDTATQLEHAGVQSTVAPVPVNVDPVLDLVAVTASKSLATAAAKTAVRPEAFGVNAGLKTGAEAVVEREVQPVIEQSVEPTTERAADHVGEPIIKDAFEPVTSSDVETVEDKFPYRLIELSEALDGKPPTTKMAPEPLKDPKQSHTEGIKPNQHSDDTNNSDMSKKSKKDPQSKQIQKERSNSNVCSFCEKIIDGKVKIYFSEPAWACHTECLKCHVCKKAMGDLVLPIFMHAQGVQCGTCFEETLNAKT